MLKGKKKLLAAQVLLGLMIAGNAYAATDVEVTGEGTPKGSWGTITADDSTNKVLAGDWTYITSKPDGNPNDNFGAVLGDKLLLKNTDNIDGYKITMNAAIAGNNTTLIKGKKVTNNTITIGEGYPRKIELWGTTKISNVFAGSEESSGNKLRLGILESGSTDIELVDVGERNDIELIGDTANKTTANYEKMAFAGRDLTLADKAGTGKIKSADMKGNITAVRALNVTEGISAGGDITATGGLTAGNGISAGGNISGGALKAASISAGGSIDSTGDITADTLLGNGISATGAINIKGAIDALNGPSKTRAAGAGSLSGTNITAGSINASSVTATGDITTGSMTVTGDVKGNNITISNGASSVGGTLAASGNLNIKGNSTLTAGTIQLTGSDKLNITSTATGTILSAGSVVDSSGTAIDMSLAVDTSKKTTNTEGLFTKVYGTKVTGNTVTSGLQSATLSEKSKSVVETQIASLAGVITSADLLSNAGFSNASQAVQQSNAEGGSAREMVPYAAVGYGNMRQESGSYVDVQGSAFNIGFAKEVKNGSGKLLFGPMIEYGRGSYESYLDDGTKGDGNTQNFGLGVMARQNNDNGTYYEGSLRYGKLTSNYNSGDLGADYDTDANYWGAHLGLGKVFQLNDKNSIDTYCKFFYTNQGSSSANILGNNVEFDAVKSKRSRLGFRFNHATSDVRSIYAGLAWQHEFDGSACATVDGFSAPSPSIKGNSMMVELGVNVAPKSSPVSFDLGVSGWAGKQKGYSLNANMLWSF
ncbi:autotransporter domain-containing protein [Anaerovibrio lipolyticus]|uniref:autotransporter domain-containing protein n=1 Tax=Anaerovibrio lipolyticus TaxID=82374 RepID=UPI001F1A32A6|nr:autotransporter outer membrane beta-barrel domain-containing protein [Anaerovibrio lipolyticus]MCF2601571.1 autotransporter domain-containing protein [Anaerovibrio lipolyticus]